MPKILPVDTGRRFVADKKACLGWLGKSERLIAGHLAGSQHWRDSPGSQAYERSGLIFEEFKNRFQAHHPQHLHHPFRGSEELALAAELPHHGVRADQGTDARTVHVRNGTEVDDEVLYAFGLEAFQGVAKGL